MAGLRRRIAGRRPSIRTDARGYPACFVFLLATWSLTGHAQAEPWQSVRSEDGLRMETRRVAGERFDELRISTSLNVSPEAIADYLVGKYLDQKNKNIRRTFVQRGRELTIWSDVLSAPMISERCYSMRFERLALANGEIRVKFASLDYIGKTPKADCIALRTRGEWIMTPTAAGSRLTYVSLTDIGGNVPTMLVRRSLSSAAVSSVRKVIAGSSGLTLPRGLGD